MDSGRFSFLLALIRLAACSAGLVGKYYVSGTGCATPWPVRPTETYPRALSRSDPACFAYDDVIPAFPLSWGRAGQTFSAINLNETHGQMNYNCTGNCSACQMKITFQFGACIPDVIPGYADGSVWPSTGGIASASVSLGLVSVAVTFNLGFPSPNPTCETIRHSSEGTLFPTDGQNWVVKCGECLECLGLGVNICPRDFKGSVSRFCTQAGDFADLILFSGANCSGAVTTVPNTQCADVKDPTLGRRYLIVHAHQITEKFVYDTVDCTGPVNRDHPGNSFWATSPDCITVNRSQWHSQSEQWDTCFRTQRYFYSADCSGNPVHESELESRVACENSEACLPNQGGVGKSIKKVIKCSLPCVGCQVLGSPSGRRRRRDQPWCGATTKTPATTPQAGGSGGSPRGPATTQPAASGDAVTFDSETEFADCSLANSASADQSVATAQAQNLASEVGVPANEVSCDNQAKNCRRLLSGAGAGVASRQLAGAPTMVSTFKVFVPQSMTPAALVNSIASKSAAISAGMKAAIKSVAAFSNVTLVVTVRAATVVPAPSPGPAPTPDQNVSKAVRSHFVPVILLVMLSSLAVIFTC